MENKSNNPIDPQIIKKLNSILKRAKNLSLIIELKLKHGK